MKSQWYTLIFLFCISLPAFFLGSCKSSNEQNANFFPKQSADTLVLDVGFHYKSKNFTYEGKSYVCLYDVITYKKVKLYDENLNWIKTFSVDQFEDVELYDLEMITPDSVILMTNYQTNLLIALSLKTLRTKTVELNALFPFEKVNHPMEFYSSMFHGFKFNDVFVFDLKVAQASILAANRDKTSLEHIKIYDSLNKQLPYFVTVEDPFGKTPIVKHINRSKKNSKSFEDAYPNEFNYCFMGNDKIIWISRYLDYFDIYEVSTGNTIAAKIESKFTDISLPTRKWKDLEKNPEMNLTELFNNDLRTAGRVHRILYDEKNKRYNVLLLYSQERSPIKDPEVTPFIWQVYDENFVLLTEREHAPTDLVPGAVIATRKQIFFPYYNSKTYDPSQAVLVRFYY